MAPDLPDGLAAGIFHFDQKRHRTHCMGAAGKAGIIASYRRFHAVEHTFRYFFTRNILARHFTDRAVHGWVVLTRSNQQVYLFSFPVSSVM